MTHVPRLTIDQLIASLQPANDNAPISPRPPVLIALNVPEALQGIAVARKRLSRG